MKTSLIVYDLCRNYLKDHRASLPAEVYEKISGYLRSRNIPKLASVSDEFVDIGYHDVVSFRILRQVSAFFKKHRDLSDETKCAANASTLFFEAEKRCRITNRRLDYYYTKLDRLDPDLRYWLARMERYIALALGSFDDFLSDLPQRVRITSGATATRSRRESLPHRKVSKRITCTRSAEPYLQALSLFYGYGTLKIRYAERNRVLAVPKNWKTHRIIACEPDGNLPLQLAFDSWAKSCLRRLGHDLTDQFRNQRLAKLGSISGKIATLDLAAASDCLAYNTVAWLLPQSWFQYLANVRSSMYSFNGVEGRYAKFSSMGNGATFSLETLIFSAATAAVGASINSVYGDDIIVNTEVYTDLVKLLRFLGFRINEDKSFHEGPFRESCGKDYFNGVDVTPFYLRYEDRRKSTISHIVNNCVPLAVDGHLWEFLKDLIVSEKLPLVPVNMNTQSGVMIDVSSAYSQGLIRSKHHVPYFKAFVEKRKHWKGWGERFLFLWYLKRYTGQNDAPPIKWNMFAYSVQGSEVPSPIAKIVRKWVYWLPVPADRKSVV